MALTGRLCAVVVVLVAVAFPPSASASEWPLQGYWPLLEARGQTVYDISGRGHHGKLGRLPGADARDPEWITGLMGIGSALRLDGNDFIEVDETERLKPQTVTVEAWVRAPRSPGQWKYVAVKGGDRCEAGSFGLYTSVNGGMAFYVYDGRRWWRSPQAGTDVWDNRWHHVAGTYDGSKVRLFVDGMQVGTGRQYDGRIEYALEYRAFTIGAFRGACNLTFKGDVDEIRMWSAALPVEAIWGSISAMLDVEPAAPLPEDAREWYDGAV